MMPSYRWYVITLSFAAVLGWTSTAAFSAARPLTPPAPLTAGAQAAGNGVHVEISVPDGVPVQITQFRFEESRPGTLAFHCDVKNAGAVGLLAFKVEWQTYSDDRRLASFDNLEDRWPGRPVEPEGSEHFQISNVAAPSAESVTRLAGTVTYAEFEDGSRFGPEASTVFPALTAKRRAMVEQYGKWLAVFEQSGPEALRSALQRASLATPTITASAPNPSRSNAGATLMEFYNEGGVDSVVLELQRVTSLRIPE